MPENKLVVPISGEKEILGIPFSYRITGINKSKIARKGCTYLIITLNYRNVVFKGTGLYKRSDVEEPERFYYACKSLLESIIKANPVLYNAMSVDSE